MIENSDPVPAVHPPQTSPPSAVLDFDQAYCEEVAAVAVQVAGFARVLWHPAQAKVWAEEAHVSAASQAVLAFQDCYQRVQALRQPLAGLEQQALEDVIFCYRIEGKHRKQWPRLRAVMHQLARNRLHLTALLGSLDVAPAQVSPAAAKLIRKLVKATGLKTQLSQLNDRYEALEELYEGAVDRINDHSYWRDGHVLEIIIIAVLLVEVLLLLV